MSADEQTTPEAAEPPEEEQDEREWCVNATMNVAAWVHVWAATKEDALDEARSFSASMFDTDMGTAEVEFNVVPAVEVA